MAPAPDEYEITIFGAGKGESCVVHLGDRLWVVIDSCIDPTSKAPAALTYLRKLGVSVETDVRLVLATHWHEDHIKGLALLYKECKMANFALPAALSPVIINTICARARVSPNFNKTGVAELASIFEEIAVRKGNGSSCQREFAISGRILSLLGADATKARITALSPSDEMLASYMARLHVVDEGHLEYVSIPEANDISVAVSFELGSTTLLFGADLENNPNPDTGWNHVVSKFCDQISKAEFFKIPHHGSSGSHHHDVWKKLLIEKPIAVVTSYSSGSSAPPQRDDLKRLHGLTGKLYYTGRRKIEAPGVVNRHLASAGVVFKRAPHYACGRVTLRRGITDEVGVWTASVDGRASLIDGSINRTD